MNKDKALKMAVEALPELISTAQCEFDSQHKAYEGYPAMYHRYGYLKDIADDGTKTLEACKEALEQPAQEPVAWQNPNEDDRRYAFMWHGKPRNEKQFSIPLYTHPAPSWQGLSDSEILKLYNECHIYDYKMGLCFARAIEQTLRNKNDI